jgi:uncharacterized protein YbjQ (UPF0145 family)
MKNLKPYLFVIACCVSFFLSSCASVLYLGDTLPATTSVKVYYDAKDIKQQYKVIGHLAQSVSSETGMNSAKEKMIEKAKSIGADGIVFLQITVKPGSSNDAQTINADAIVFDK